MNMATLAPWLAVAGGGALGASLRFATTLWIGVPTMPTTLAALTELSATPIGACFGGVLTYLHTF